MTHREHLSEHIKSTWAPTVHPDGRKHLLSAPNGLSKLAEAMAPDANLADFDDHYLCGDKPLVEPEVLKMKLALAAVSWMAPRSLRNSMESWRSSGLLDIADEKMIFLNSPTPEDLEIAHEFDFDIYTTDERNGNVMAGPAIAYLVGNSSSDIILFLEKDFVVSSTREVMMRELWTGNQHLARGVDVYRLRGNTDYPAEGMPDCCTKAIPPTCPYHSSWKSGGYFGDHMCVCVCFYGFDALKNLGFSIFSCV
jgi:hypothetical protein